MKIYLEVTALQRISKLFLQIIFDKNICHDDLCLHMSKKESTAMFYHMLNFVSTKPSKYFFQRFYKVMLMIL